MKPLVCGCVVALALLISSRPANAEAILFTGTGPGASGVTLNASAFFDISGSTLTITLSNLGDTSGTGTSTDKAANQLAGLFFDLPNGFTLTPVSANIDAGTILQSSSCNSGANCGTTTNVGGEFRYNASSGYSVYGGADRGISSGGQTGDLAGNMGGSNLDDPSTVGGANFLIVAPTTAANPFNPDSSLTSKPVIEGTVEFALTISGGTLTAADLKNVSFQYGTSTTDPRLVGSAAGAAVPEPATAFLALSGMAFAMKRYSRSRKARTQA